MKKKLFSAIIVGILALSTAMSLVGCSGTKPKNTFLTEDYSIVTYTSLTKIDELEGYGIKNSSGDLFLFDKTDLETGFVTQIVYNLATGTKVLELTETDEVSYSINIKMIGYNADYNPIQYITVSKTIDPAEGETTILHTLYSKAGVAIDSVEEMAIYSNDNARLIILDNLCYTIDDDSNITLGFEIGLAGIPAFHFNAVSDDYYYYQYEETIYMYDKAGKLLSTYQIPSYVDDEYEWYVLENGNLFIQYIVEVDAYSDDYDFIEYGDSVLNPTSKYDLVTKIINPKNGKVKDVDTDVCVLGDDGFIYSGNELKFNGYNPDLKNLAYGNEIVDKKVDFNDVKMYKLSNDGKFEAIKEFVPDMYWGWYSNDHYFIENYNEQVFLFNAKGKLIGEITNYEYVSDKYIATEYAIYDYTLTKVYDLKANGYTVYSSLKDSLVLSDAEGDKYIFNDGTVTKVTGEGISARFEYSWYYLREVTAEGITYTIYNAVGTRLGTLDDVDDYYYAMSNDVLLLASGTSYYRAV